MARESVEYRSIVRQRRLMRFAAVGVLCVIAGVVFGDHFGLFGWTGTDQARFDRRKFTIEGIDEDGTLLLSHAPTRVWLNGAAEVDAEGLRPYVGRQVIVRLEPLQTRDDRGRLLAYLYLSAKDVLNVDAVRLGVAKADRSSHHSLRAVMEGAEADARKHRRGMWSEGDE